MFKLTHNDKCQGVFFTPDEPAVDEGARVMRAIRGFARELSPRRALVFAAQRYPDDALTVAAEKVANEFSNMRAQMNWIDSKVQKERKMETLRLAPFSRAATIRMGAITAGIAKVVQQIDAINRSKLGLDSDKKKSKADQLRENGVSEAEVERICGKEKSLAELAFEKSALEAEANKIRLFEKTRDPSVLPTHVLQGVVAVKTVDPIKGEIVTVEPYEVSGVEQ